MKRHSKGELLGLSREPPDHGDDAAGRYREMASTDAGSLRGVQHAQRLERLLIIVEGLALSHHHDTRGPGLEILTDMNDLVVHLCVRKPAREAALARGAEHAAHAAPRLRGDADRETVPRRHADTLGGDAVGVAKQVLPAAISGNLASHLGGSAEIATFLKLRAKLGGNVGHFVKGRDAVLPNPVLNLLGTELGPAQLIDEGHELVVRKGPEVKRLGIRVGIM